MDNSGSQNRREPIPLRPKSSSNKPQLSRDELRSKKKKKLKRRRKIRKILFSFVLLALVIAAGIVLAFTVFFKINTIQVKGDTVYSQKVVIEKSGVNVGDNLFRVNAEQLASKLSKSLPYISSVSIKRELPDKLIIQVKNTRESAAVSYNGKYILIDSNGKILDSDATLLREGVAVIGGVKPSSPVEGEKISFGDENREDAVLRILSAASSAELTGLTEINVKSLSAIKLKYDGRITLEIGTLVNIETKLLRAKAAIDKENDISKYTKGTLDLTVDPYAYFRAGEETTTKKSSKSTAKTSTQQ